MVAKGQAVHLRHYEGVGLLGAEEAQSFRGPGLMRLPVCPSSPSTPPSTLGVGVLGYRLPLGVEPLAVPACSSVLTRRYPMTCMVFSSLGRAA